MERTIPVGRRDVEVGVRGELELWFVDDGWAERVLEDGGETATVPVVRDTTTVVALPCAVPGGCVCVCVCVLRTSFLTVSSP